MRIPLRKRRQWVLPVAASPVARRTRERKMEVATARGMQMRRNFLDPTVPCSLVLQTVSDC